MNLRFVFPSLVFALLLSGCGPTIIEPKGKVHGATVLGQDVVALKDAVRILEVVDEVGPDNKFSYKIKVSYSLKSKESAIVDFTSNISDLDIYGVNVRQEVVRGSGVLEATLKFKASDRINPKIKSYQLGVYLRAGPEGRTLADDSKSIPFEQTRARIRRAP